MNFLLPFIVWLKETYSRTEMTKKLSLFYRYSIGVYWITIIISENTVIESIFTVSINTKLPNLIGEPEAVEITL